MRTEVAFRAWSCTMRLAVADPGALLPATRALRALLAEVDAAASRFRPDSELVRVNRLAGRPVPVSRTLARLVRTALAAAADSGGAVDPTLGADLAALGYDRDIDAVRGRDLRPRQGFEETTNRPGWRDVVLDDAAGLLTVPPGLALDLGATAKAATADRAVAELAPRFGGVLVELGGDLAAAGTAPHTRGWSVAVAEQAGGPAQRVLFEGGGLATSTTTVRTWKVDGERVHHLLDPRTRQPVSGPWRTVTVAAPSALAANIASTGALVQGAGAVSWLGRRALAARLVATGGAVRALGGWPDPALRRAA